MKYLLGGIAVFVASILMTTYLDSSYITSLSSDGYLVPNLLMDTIVYTTAFLYAFFGYLTFRIEKKYVAGTIFILLGIFKFLCYVIWAIPVI